MSQNQKCKAMEGLEWIQEERGSNKEERNQGVGHAMAIVILQCQLKPQEMEMAGRR